MIAGGVPKPIPGHAVHVAEMALSMLNALKTLKDPSDPTGQRHLQLRIGKWIQLACDELKNF